ncbi:ATP-binding protein [Thermodesulfobacteriota bacterium]
MRDQSISREKAEKPHIPIAFYKGVLKQHEDLGKRWHRGEAIPFFFKISDIRELNIGDSEHLLEATKKTGYDFEQFRWHETTSPAFVREKPPFPNWFDDTTRHWREVLKTGEDLDPGKFRTDEVKEVYYQALQYATINRPILIEGSRGPGKTHLAKFIRRNSQYSKEKYSGDWPVISCADYKNPPDLKSLEFPDDETLSGETLVLDDIEHMPHFLVRRILNEYEKRAKREVSNDPSTKAFRLIGCTSLDPHELRENLDPRFLTLLQHFLKCPHSGTLSRKTRRRSGVINMSKLGSNSFPMNPLLRWSLKKRRNFLRLFTNIALTGIFVISDVLLPGYCLNSNSERQFPRRKTRLILRQIE